MYKLFEVTGVELEYMIVDQETLRVKPYAEHVLFPKSGGKPDVENGDIDWSNELVSHVIELKTHQPAPDLSGLHQSFHNNIIEINEMLRGHNAKLLSTGAHPFMDPNYETVIWPHEHNQIYDLYNKIFGCKGHGWSNLQSMHINLPFEDDVAFARLHAAIRVLLPVIPALTASTPILDGKITGFADTRLEYYRKNQSRIPVITGHVIPEPAFDEQSYYARIFEPIRQAIKPFDPENILEHHFLNSRGAIARFDRGAIEIRLIDLQEAPVADLAIAEFVVGVLKLLCQERWSDLRHQQSIDEVSLSKVLLDAIVKGDSTFIHHPQLLKCLGIEKSSESVITMLDKLANASSLSADAALVIEHILRYGSLSTRIVKQSGMDPSESTIRDVYQRLADCLQANVLF